MIQIKAIQSVEAGFWTDRHIALRKAALKRNIYFLRFLVLVVPIAVTVLYTTFSDILQSICGTPLGARFETTLMSCSWNDACLPAIVQLVSANIVSPSVQLERSGTSLATGQSDLGLLGYSFFRGSLPIKQ